MIEDYIHYKAPYLSGNLGERPVDSLSAAPVFPSPAQLYKPTGLLFCAFMY